MEYRNGIRKKSVRQKSFFIVTSTFTALDTAAILILPGTLLNRVKAALSCLNRRPMGNRVGYLNFGLFGVGWIVKNRRINEDAAG